MLDFSQFPEYVPRPSDTPSVRFPSGPSASIPCPSILAGEAKKEWTRINKELKRLLFLDHVDRALLTMYCMTWAEYLESLAMVAVDGVGTPASQTTGKWLKTSCERRLLNLANELGLSPNARARIKKAMGTNPSDIPEIMSRDICNN